MNMTKDMYLQKFNVSYEYPVHFTRDIFSAGNSLLFDSIDRLNEGRKHRVQVFIDAGVIAARPGIVESITEYFSHYGDRLELVCPPESVVGGEQAKNSREAAELVMESIAARHLCRQSFVVGVGGGSALDIIGLAAALVHRGVRLVRVPTTVLGQNDSGVGVKNGIDAYGVKNYAGTFAPPFAVINDFNFLDTLDDKYWVGGVAEAFKVAIIKDPGLFGYLCDHADELRQRNMTVMEHVVRETALLHLEHIGSTGDPFEFGMARPLDFGHWSAHRLEVLSDYEIGHGQAVAVGIALDSYYACRTGYISQKELDAVISGLKRTGLPVWSDLLEAQTDDGDFEIIRGLADFQEHLGGELHVTLPAGFGAKVEVNTMDKTIILDGVKYLSENRS